MILVVFLARYMKVRIKNGMFSFLIIVNKGCTIRNKISLLNYTKKRYRLGTNLCSRKNIQVQGLSMPQVCTMIKWGHVKLFLWTYNEHVESNTALNYNWHPFIWCKHFWKRKSKHRGGKKWNLEGLCPIHPSIKTYIYLSVYMYVHLRVKQVLSFSLYVLASPR